MKKPKLLRLTKKTKVKLSGYQLLVFSLLLDIGEATFDTAEVRPLRKKVNQALFALGVSIKRNLSGADLLKDLLKESEEMEKIERLWFKSLTPANERGH